MSRRRAPLLVPVLAALVGVLLGARPAPAAPPPTAPASAPAAAPARAAAAIVDEDPPPRLSLPTETDRAAWHKPGFRLALGLAYGGLAGIDGAPTGQVVGPLVRFGVRLDQSWSLQASLQYHYAMRGLSGIRFAGTVEPTWHATDRLTVALGLGFGGIVENATSRADPTPLPSTLDTSYTFPSARTPVPSCNGVGVAGLVRGEYLVVIGPRSATGLALELGAQWTGCVQDTSRLEPDTATAIVRRQWWPHLGASLAWVIAWR
ncbi:MAG TPA: hypothetical protein VGQ83_07570 [Polyangia bacterium]|jgi:hypothetical protein